MTQYINKATVIAEIEKRINGINPDTIEDWRYRIQWEHDIEVMNNILSLINTIEVKEVDLKKEIANQYESNYEEYLLYEEFADIARHFFELGMEGG